VPGWIGNHGDVVEGGRSAEALVWEQWPLLGDVASCHGNFDLLWMCECHFVAAVGKKAAIVAAIS